MKFNSKLTWGLAWAGLAVVLIVPSADFLAGGDNAGKATALTSGMEAVKPAIASVSKIVPVPKVASKTTAPASSDPVDQLLARGKKLPSYISAGATTPDAAKPAGSPPETESAALPEAAIPVPAPRAQRPPPVATASAEAPLIIDETTPQRTNDGDVTGDIDGQHLQSWDAQSLTDYLDQQGLIEDSQANVTQHATQPSPDYDPDGFFLSDGPNGVRRAPHHFDPNSDNPDDWDFWLF